MNKPSFSLKEVIVISSITLILTVGIYSSIHLLIVISQDGSDWVSPLISSIGNILGGIIGGIVAYVVAKYQTNKAFALQREEDKQKTKSLLRLLKEELQNNIVAMESEKPYQADNYNRLVSNLSEDIWLASVTQLHASHRLISMLSVCYKKLSAIKQLESSELDDNLIIDTIDRYNKTIEAIDEELNT